MSLLERKIKVSESMAQSEKCPSCGGNLIFSAEEQTLNCSFCGKSYTPEKLDLLSHIKVYDQDEAEEEEADKNEIVCNSCGANIIADKFTTATVCAFCGSPSLVVKRLGRQFRPDYIVPFKVTREEAEKKIREFAKTKKYVPSDFFGDKNIKRLQGIYVPFWLMDSRCEITVFGTGVKQRMGYKDMYSVQAGREIHLVNVPFDGSLDINDQLMEGIEPFDSSELVPFKTSYLQGYFAKRYDVAIDKQLDRIFYRMEAFGKEAVKFTMDKDYTDFNFDCCSVRVKEPKQKYVLYPVWLLTYEYDGLYYQIALNGQTGKVDGNFPVSKVKKALRYSLLGLEIALRTLLIFSPLLVLGFFVRKYMGLILYFTCIIAGVTTLVMLIYGMTEMGVNAAGGALTKLLYKPLAWLRKKTDKIREEINMTKRDKPKFDAYNIFSEMKDLGSVEKYIEKVRVSDVTPGDIIY